MARAHSCRPACRYCDGANKRQRRPLIHVDAYARNGTAYGAAGKRVLYEYAAQLAVANINIVGPLDQRRRQPNPYHQRMMTPEPLWLDSCGSTNTELAAMPDAPHGFVVATREQTAGRGQRGLIKVVLPAPISP